MTQVGEKELPATFPHDRYRWIGRRSKFPFNSLDEALQTITEAYPLATVERISPLESLATSPDGMVVGRVWASRSRGHPGAIRWWSRMVTPQGV